jgi:hypothetical protein
MTKNKSKPKMSREEQNKRRKGLELIEEWMLKLEKTSDSDKENE